MAWVGHHTPDTRRMLEILCKTICTASLVKNMMPVYLALTKHGYIDRTLTASLSSWLKQKIAVSSFYQPLARVSCFKCRLRLAAENGRPIYDATP